MTQRSIHAGLAPNVIIKTGTSVIVEGWDSDQVRAETDARGGLKVDARREKEFARARAVIGERTLFDVRLKLPGGEGKSELEEVIEVQVGSGGRVRVPLESRVKVYAGTNVEVSDIQGSLAIYAGGSVRVRNVRSLVHGSSGGQLDLECETVEEDEAKFEAGRDLRCYIRDLTSAKIIVNDLGGYWEGTIGAGRVTVRLKAGGDATLVTDQKVETVPPHYLLGQIERPAEPEV